MRFAVCATGLDQARRTAASLASQRVTAIEAGPAWFLGHDPDDARELGATFRDQGVEVFSIHAPFRGDHDLSHPDAGLRQTMIDLVAGLLDRASQAKVRNVVVHPANHAPEQIHGDLLLNTVKSLRILAPIAEKFGVTLALENLPPGYPGSNGESLLAIVRDIDSPRLGICLDTGHAHMTGLLLECFQQLKSRIVHIHMHDNDGRRDIHLPPPYGTINWESFYRLFRTVGFESPVVLECSPWMDELGEGRGTDADFTRLIDSAEELFGHLERRISYEEQQRRVDPTWRLSAMTPHRRDLKV